MKHDDFVLIAINDLVREGATKIYADIKGYGNPNEINGFIPDISAHFGQGKIVCEIETIEAISDKHTKEQWTAFATASNPFRAYVPKSVEATAKENVSKWGIASKTKIWNFPNH